MSRGGSAGPYGRSGCCRDESAGQMRYNGQMSGIGESYTCARCGFQKTGSDDLAAHYKRLFGLQQQGRDLRRHIITGGGYRGSHYGMVAATYPEGSRLANEDSWRCHHDHPDDLSALECALNEVRRLAVIGTYHPCSAGPDCQDEFCRRDWARVMRVTPCLHRASAPIGLEAGPSATPFRR